MVNIDKNLNLSKWTPWRVTRTFKNIKATAFQQYFRHCSFY